MDATFQWTKQFASHFCGTGNGLVISWPERIKKGRGVRSPFHHVIDIMPTILEATGLPQSRSINGVTQKPVDCGEDTGTPVSEDYKVLFKFTGEIDNVTIELK
jgi:arylsulfatase A-like enzyme